MISKNGLMAVFLVIGLMAYNYFSGTAKEKEQAQNIFLKGAEIVNAGADLLKSEYEKLHNGKYDEALDNINSLLIKMKDKGGELVGKIANWEKRKEEWDQKKNDLKKVIDSSSSFANGEVRKAAEDLVREGKKLRAKVNFLKKKQNNHW